MDALHWRDDHPKRGKPMLRSLTISGGILLAIMGMILTLSAQPAQAIEHELVLITPVGKTLTDPALGEFTRYAWQRWNITVRASAIAAGGRVLEWNGRPAADILWGGEAVLFDRLAERGLLALLQLSPSVADSIPVSIGQPKPVRLRDPKGFWIGTLIESYGIVYHPKVFRRLGLSEPSDWDDLLNPRLRGEVVQCAPTLSGSSHGAYEVILQRDGEQKGWDWLKRLASNTGMFAARSRDVSSLVGKGRVCCRLRRTELHGPGRPPGRF
jgi:iron(III) transport system substrate-binding protein